MGKSCLLATRHNIVSHASLPGSRPDFIGGIPRKRHAGNYGGRHLARKVFNRRFDLGCTGSVIDQFGQRLIHEKLSDMDPIAGVYKPVLQLHFTKPKSVMRLDDIDWGGSPNSSNAVPLNEPVCGYQGDGGPCAEGQTVFPMDYVHMS
ncbi:hypothetical protein RvY_16637 [Ramazzottius varieornatus]|uniref:Uncharacterized protein n=1 Tax=Ramazzottius varieornatus TaxID=947166 RepID=A0A1D1VZX4_RAMVA|nr:hypothetical protein RvY_16637 [Ramazzottius varieornatus]